MEPDDLRHGTYAGAQRHQKEGEAACEPCRVARASYMAARRADPAIRESERRHAYAADRARRRLVALHREEYERLYLEECADLVEYVDAPL